MKPTLKGMREIAGSGEQLDNALKENSCGSNHGEGAPGNGSMARKQKERSSSPANSKTVTVKSKSRGAGSDVIGNTVRIRHVVKDILPCV